MKTRGLTSIFLSSLIAGCGAGGGDGVENTTALKAGPATEVISSSQARALTRTTDTLVAPMYAIEFVGTAATGYALNDAGDVVGKSYADPGCGPFCLPPLEIAVWKRGNRMVLPSVPGFGDSAQYPLYINNQGIIGGEAGIIGSSTHAAVWMPGATGYTARDLGTFPGTSSADVYGLDEQGRIVGWATLGGAIPTLAVPFMWSQGEGMVNLVASGYPNERPAAMSPGGMVVTTNSTYQLGQPTSASPLPLLPRGFLGAGSNGSAINDAGDQAHFLVSAGIQNLVYPFRLAADGTWQQISATGTGRLSRSRMGSISAAKDVTFTALGTGMIAAGPVGLAQPLGPLVSPAYPGASVTDGGPMNASGQILAQVLIGRSQRLVKLTPAPTCGADCLVSRSLVMTGQFVQDPALPGSCVQGGKMYNMSSATVTIVSETGAPLANVTVSGRFLDDYWTNRQVTGTTNASGVVTWTHKGVCGVGAVAFFVDDAVLGTKRFDRTRGILTNYVIPTATGDRQTDTKGSPVALPSVDCVAGKTCTFNGSRSYDPDGTIVAYRWADTNGNTLSKQAVFTMTFNKAGRDSATLYVTDNTGLTGSRKVTYTVLR